MASLAGWWRQTGVAPPDGTLVGCVQGRQSPAEQRDSSYALRSTDGGRSWSLSAIARATERVAFSEAFLFLKRDGRLLEDAPPRAVAGPEDLHPTASGVVPGVSRDVRAIDMDARPQSYITGSRYTEGYVRPLGR